jgi:hypothetical protein
MLLEADNPRPVESLIKMRFKEEFRLHRGLEYFEGPEDQVTRLFYDIWQQCRAIVKPAIKLHTVLNSAQHKLECTETSSNEEKQVKHPPETCYEKIQVTCLRCGYNAGYLQRLKEHLSRKNICPATKRNMTPEEVYNYYASKLNHKNTPPICDFCGKEYPEKNTAFRMHRSRCKKNFEDKMKSELSIPDEEPMTIEKKYELSQEQIAKLKEQIEALQKTNIIHNG